MALPREEITRKLLHLIALTIPAGILYLPRVPGLGHWTPPLVLAGLNTVHLGIEYARFRNPAVQRLFYRFFGMMLRTGEAVKLTGSTYIFMAAFACSILFYGREHITFMVLTLFILGDAAAALVGMGIGTVRIGNKTLEGSCACFVVCMVLLFGIFPSVPYLLRAWDGRIGPVRAVATALCITVFELVPVRVGRYEINDNLIVPVITGILLLTLQRMGI